MNVVEKPLAMIGGRHRSTGDGVNLVANHYRKGHRIEPHHHREAQLVYAAREEMAVTLSDALLRRTGAGFGPRQAIDGLEEAAHILQTVHGWDDARKVAEIDAYRREIEPMRRFASPAA